MPSNSDEEIYDDENSYEENSDEGSFDKEN